MVNVDHRLIQGDEDNIENPLQLLLDTYPKAVPKFES